MGILCEVKYCYVNQIKYNFPSNFIKSIYLGILCRPNHIINYKLPNIPTLDFICEVLKIIDIQNIRKSAADNKMPPYEVQWTVSFYKALSYFLPPEKHFITLGCHKKTAGYVDFYINGSLKWLIELCREGSNVNEHVNRNEKNYKDINCNYYLVIDFRKKAPEYKHHNLISVCYNQEFTHFSVYQRDIVKNVKIMEI
jgi:hypothetical protein